MSFQFRMQKVLDLKLKEKELAEWHVAQVTQEKREKEEEVSRIQYERDSIQLKIADVSESIVCVAELQNMNVYVNHVNSLLYQETIKLNDINDKYEESRETLINKFIEVKSWDQIKSKAYSEYKIEQSRIERIQIEESALSQFTRKIQTIK